MAHCSCGLLTLPSQSGDGGEGGAWKTGKVKTCRRPRKKCHRRRVAAPGPWIQVRVAQQQVGRPFHIGAAFWLSLALASTGSAHEESRERRRQHR